MTTSSNAGRVDAIVIGAGSGGLTVAVGLSRLGKRVVMVEAADVGGDCTNVGCIPSKSLLHHSREHAMSTRPTAAVLSTVRARRTSLRDRETEEFGSTAGIDLRFGRARIVAPGRVELRRADAMVEVLEADHVVIATGSRPRRVPIEGLPEELVVTNQELFELPDVPRSMVVVGGGPIGLEMAVAFSRLGTKVTVLEAAGQILPAMLPEAASVVAEALARQGIEVRVGTVAHRAAVNGTGPDAGATLHVGPPGSATTDRIDDVDLVLMAVGRESNTDDLGLASLGVELDRGGRIVIDPKGRTSVDNVWACGDVTDRGGTTHDANAWGRRIIKHIVAPIAPAGDLPEQPTVTFTDPEAATIGVQPVEVPADVRRLRVAFAEVDRGYTDEVVDGVLIVDVRRFSGRVMGATIVGPRAGELLSVFALAMKNDLAFHKWYGTVWPYPTYASALGQLVDDYMTATVTNIPGELAGWVRGRFRRR